MNRLHHELQRLYLPLADALADALAAPASADTHALPTVGLVDATGRVRALVLQLAAPADWAVLSPVWRAVQAELDLPAPGIAVSGQDGLQLWFSLTQAVPAAQGRAFLQALATRHLAGVRPHRIRLLPEILPESPPETAPEAPPETPPGPLCASPHAPAPTLRHALLVPAVWPATGHWSAFVSAELASMFADEPWLDTPPGTDAQAGLLARLHSATPAAWQHACAQLGLESPAAAAPAASLPTTALPGARPHDAGAPVQHLPGAPGGAFGLASGSAAHEAQVFLLGVLRDASVPLALRIDAARALLCPGQAPTPAADGR